MFDPTVTPTHRLADALDELPLFPLPQVVLFPRALLPLHVFEPRYRAMLRDSLRSHGAIAIVQLAAGSAPTSIDAPSSSVPSEPPPTEPAPFNQTNVRGHHPPIARIAGAGLVIEHESLADGRANIVVRGAARVAIEELPFTGPYRRARARVIEDRDVRVPDADIAALIHAASHFAAAVRRKDPEFSFRIPDTRTPGALADACAFHLLVRSEARQAILEDLDPRTRVLRVLQELSAQRLELDSIAPRGLS